MTRCGSFPTQFAVIAMLMIVLLAAPVSSSAAATVSHFVANGPFTDAFPSCNANGVCAQLAVFSGGSAIFYALFLPDGSSFQGFGTIPSENVTHIDSQTLTLAPTDTSTIDPALFTNLFCDVNFNCTASPGGIVSGTWTRTKLSSSHSVFSTVSHTGPVQTSSHGSMDDFSANAQFSILGDGFQGPGDIGTQHNTQITVTVP